VEEGELGWTVYFSNSWLVQRRGACVEGMPSIDASALSTTAVGLSLERDGQIV